jgi:hypothetical protein
VVLCEDNNREKVDQSGILLRRRSHPYSHFTFTGAPCSLAAEPPSSPSLLGPRTRSATVSTGFLAKPFSVHSISTASAISTSSGQAEFRPFSQPAVLCSDDPPQNPWTCCFVPTCRRLGGCLSIENSLLVAITREQSADPLCFPFPSLLSSTQWDCSLSAIFVNNTTFLSDQLKFAPRPP